MKKVVVIGGGAAGMIASGILAERGYKTILLEKNNILGKKLLITGKGRCNITNDSNNIDNIMKNIPRNGKFMFSALNNFSNRDIKKFFLKRGLKLKVERGGRIFPESDKAKDVVVCLEKYINEKNVKVFKNSKVENISINNCSIKSVICNNGKEFFCDAVIVATGGKSYHKTGSDGYGYIMVKKLGHSITDIKPSLVPLVSNDNWVKNLQGLSLKNIAIKLTKENGKKIYEDFGELIFTHFGLSGPVILSASSHAIKYDFKNIYIEIDLKPALDENLLDKRISRDFQKYINKQFKNSLNDLFPKKLIPVIIELSKINENKIVNQITKEERLRLLNLIKSLKVRINGSRPIDEAIVTSGGVEVKEINPSTMESKIIKGLYFAGEIIDVDGYTGGYNLTIAFSTGVLAGNSIY